ncbi:esterase-like activity of phytase family protein [Sphingopyxis sp. PAMC25046]|uniref:esterase-like activity of phytase family protein n=1 Tax=Sphingopyxis sp. PAMC25046 TaxID=2565556 RepID=UPI00109DB363|nr:esterase-like activity of phytase family protein [Sphingopyxis sp. PAMC25046]QCB53369.1 esterase-like activity of phytase family protein [Sphingopyxis sp. PAMC25046]
MRRLLTAALIFAALGPMPGTVMRAPEPDLTESAAARPLAFAPEAAGTLRFVRGWHLVSPHSRFGGFSALAREAGADRFQLVGDNGYWTRLALDSRGAVSDVRIRPLPTPDGRPARKSMADAEAMFVDRASGKSWIALEGINEIWRLDADLAAIEARRKLPRPRWPGNLGPEAMVRLGDGRTVVFSEEARRREGLLYSGDPAAPGPPPLRFFYDSDGRGPVSDAAPLPDGRILLVHRRLGFDPVFTTILSIADPADIKADAVVRSRTIGRVPPRLAENYEGAAVSVEGGRTFLWLVADNNFNVWQRSLLLQFELVDLPPKKTPDSKKAAP